MVRNTCKKQVEHAELVGWFIHSLFIRFQGLGANHDHWTMFSDLDTASPLVKAILV